MNLSEFWLCTEPETQNRRARIDGAERGATWVLSCRGAGRCQLRANAADSISEEPGCFTFTKKR